MTDLPLLLLLGLGTMQVAARVKEELTIVPPEDIAKKRAPIFCAVHRVAPDRVGLDIAFKDAGNDRAEFTSFELRVFKRRVSDSELQEALKDSDLIARAQCFWQKKATFEVTRDEIPCSYVVLHSRLERVGDGARTVCLSVRSLIEQLAVGSSNPWRAELARPENLGPAA